MKSLLALLLFLVLLLFATSALSAQTVARTNQVPLITLSWNAVSGSTNYNLYYGVATGTYTNKIATGTLTSTPVANLTRGVTYFFAVTDVEGHGLESLYSTEVTYTVPNFLPPPSALNIIVNSP